MKDRATQGPVIAPEKKDGALETQLGSSFLKFTYNFTQHNRTLLLMFSLILSHTVYCTYFPSDKEIDKEEDFAEFRKSNLPQFSALI